MADKIRLDKLLIDSGLVESRQVARSLIMQGLVLVNDEPLTKPGCSVSKDAQVRLKELARIQRRFVGRGGEKLQAALEHFNLSVKNRVAIDIGASTGGFTDCLLQAGASLVYAVDVGIAQLAQKIRDDERVRVYEKLNAKDLGSISFEPVPSLAVVDVSFISVRKIMPSIIEAMSDEFQVVVLVKPQFELSRSEIGKGGVVVREKDRIKAIELVREEALALGLTCSAPLASPITGAKKGNQEYLCLLEKSWSAEI